MKRPAVLALTLLMVGCATTPLEDWMVGQLELRSGNIPLAVRRLELSRAKDPEFAPVYLALAAAYTKLHDYDQVVRHLDTFLRLDPEHPTAHLYLAEALFEQDQLPPAKTHFEFYLEWLSRQPEPKVEHRLRCHERLAEIGWSLDDAEFAHRHAGQFYALQSRQLLPTDPEQSVASRQEACSHFAAADEIKPLTRELREQWTTMRSE